MSTCIFSEKNLKNIAIAGVSLAALYVLYKQFCPAAVKKATDPATAATSSSSSSTAVPTPAAADALNALVVSGPSGTGKGTLIGLLKQKYPDALVVSVSHTSRAPREKEVDGVDYHFSKKEQMEEMEKRGDFLELCPVHDNYYGTTRAAVTNARATGKFCIIECDVQGSQKIRASIEKTKDLNAAFMFITSPSLTELEARIVKRGSDAPDVVQKRLATARKELAFLDSEAGKKHFDFVLMNDNLDASFARFEEFLKTKKALPVNKA